MNILEMVRPNVAAVFFWVVGVFKAAKPPTLYHTGLPDNSCTGLELCVSCPCFERNIRKAWTYKNQKDKLIQNVLWYLII